MKTKTLAIVAVLAALLTAGAAFAYSPMDSQMSDEDYAQSMDKDSDGICDYCAGQMKVEECLEMRGQMGSMMGSQMGTNMQSTMGQMHGSSGMGTGIGGMGSIMASMDEGSHKSMHQAMHGSLDGFEEMMGTMGQ